MNSVAADFKPNADDRVRLRARVTEMLIGVSASVMNIIVVVLLEPFRVQLSYGTALDSLFYRISDRITASHLSGNALGRRAIAGPA